MSKKDSDHFWNVIFIGFTILVVVGTIMTVLDNKVPNICGMEQAVLINTGEVKPKTPQAGESPRHE